MKILSLIAIVLSATASSIAQDSLLAVNSWSDTIEIDWSIPELCPEPNPYEDLYNPAFLLTSDYYVNRYNETDLMYKVVDNFGNGFDSLYGTRNMRPILHGVAYRGGANNFYHKTAKRDNHNPLPNDGINNLCREGFSHSIYLYKTNWETAPETTECDCVNEEKNEMKYDQLDYFEKDHVYQMLKSVYESATDENKGPVYLHCWNGWHASGFISAVILKQFCGFNDMEAVAYWDLGTDGANTSPRYNSIRDQIRDFEPYPEFVLKDSLGNRICPPMPGDVDSSELHLTVEHLLIVPEGIPLNTILILENLKFPAGKTTIAAPGSNQDVADLLAALKKSPKISVQISGHTDRSGKESTNRQLSKDRAKFIYDFLIKNGIDERRLTYKGWGSSRPAYTNKTKSGRAANRRIEVQVTGKAAESMDKLVDEKVDSTPKPKVTLESLVSFDLEQTYVMRGIIFEPNQTDLNDPSKVQADSLLNLLVTHPELTVEIVGYTDMSGIAEKNVHLSMLRAKSLHDYLIEKGIDPGRLFFLWVW